MSNATLVLLITAAVLAQVAAISLFNWQRQRVRLQALERQGISDPETTVGIDASPPNLGVEPQPLTGAAPGAAWSGYRAFVAQRRVIEDGTGAVCSFYLVPADGQPLPTYRPGQHLTFRLEVPDPADGPPKTLAL